MLICFFSFIFSFFRAINQSSIIDFTFNTKNYFDFDNQSTSLSSLSSFSTTTTTTSLLIDQISVLLNSPNHNSCLILGQSDHPINDIISIYYQECYNVPDCLFYHRKFNELSNDDLTAYLKSKSLSSIDIFNEYLYTHQSFNSWCQLFQFPSLIGSNKRFDMDQVFKLLQKRLKSCVIVFDNNKNDTQKLILQHWFPWLNQTNFQKFISNNVNHGLKTVTNIETVETIRTDLREIIEFVYSCDLKLYKWMLNFYNKQISVLLDVSYQLN